MWPSLSLSGGLFPLPLPNLTSGKREFCLATEIKPQKPRSDTILVKIKSLIKTSKIMFTMMTKSRYQAEL